MSTLTYRQLHDDADVQAFSTILSISFGAELEDTQEWIEKDGREHARLISTERGVAGGLVLIPMGQFFGGCSVPMTGIAAVAVDPGERAAGGATTLMQEAVRELHARGTALSALFPATQPVYRRAGYEQAGGHFGVRLEPEKLLTSERDLNLRRVKEEDRADIERVHGEQARENDGNLDRCPSMWERVRESRKGVVHAFVVEGEAGLEGYVYYLARKNPQGHQDLHLLDIVARTPAAARRLLTFFRDHRSLVDSVNYRAHPGDPLLLQAREQRHEVGLRDTWMLRIVDVERALAARGYPASADAEVHFELQDDVVPANQGRFVLHVAQGQGRVERGGQGRVRLDVRTLAPLYSGFASPHQLSAGFGLDCAGADARTLAALFAGPAPWMQDGF